MMMIMVMMMIMMMTCCITHFEKKVCDQVYIEMDH